MTVYIVHKDVDYEFGHNCYVGESRELAEEFIAGLLGFTDSTGCFHPDNKEEYSIEEWVVDASN